MKSPILNKLKELPLKWLAKLFSDAHSAIVGILVLAAFSSIGVVVIFFQDLWLALISAMQSPAPLWVAIMLAIFVFACMFLKNTQFRSQLTSNKKERFFTTNKMKWRVEIYKDYFKVDKLPFCVKHDVQFIYSHNKKYCPGTLQESCDNHLIDKDDFKVYEAVKSIIESKIRNGEDLC